MEHTTGVNIDDETISKIGLIPYDQSVNPPIAPGARVFQYPHLDEVYIMESDLYGNAMPPDSCFLACKGLHGMVGNHLKVETLKNASTEDIINMVQSNQEG